MSKASAGDRIPPELFKILKDDAAKVTHSICQQIWKLEQVAVPFSRGSSQPRDQTQVSCTASGFFTS